MKKFCGFIRDCVEKYIPIIAFVVLFVVFIFQVFMRYVVRQPQAWTVEVEQSCFLWLVLLGACYAQRVKGHVTFSLFYDMMGIKGKALTLIAGDALIVFTCLITIFPSFHYIWGLFERHQVTTLLKWPKTIVFFPYVIFLAIILIYSLIEIYESLMALQGKKEYVDKIVQDSKSEAEQAIEASLSQEQLDLNDIDYEGKGDA